LPPQSQTPWTTRVSFEAFVEASKDGAKDQPTKVLQEFLRQEGLSHEVTERYCPQSIGLGERLNLTIRDKVLCMLIDASLTPKLWPFAAQYAALIYNNLSHSALDLHKSTNDAYGDSSGFCSSTSSVVFVILFNRRSFYMSWRRDQQKDSVLALILLATKFRTYEAKLLM